MTVTLDDIIGRGLAFPFVIDDKGGVRLTGGWDLIKASIHNVVAFVIGTRYFLGEFGINPVDLLEEPNDDITASILEYRLQTQIPLWDKRVTIEDVQLSRPDDSQLNIEVTVGLIGTSLQQIFIFPFTLSSVS